MCVWMGCAGSPVPVPAGASLAGRASSVTSASHTRAVCMALASSLGSASATPTGEASSATKVQHPRILLPRLYLVAQDF